MKTKQELILDFMLALATNIYASQWRNPEEVYNDACLLVDQYLENN